MDIDNGTLFSIVLLIHMALTGIALMRLFRLKTATLGFVVLSLLALMIPIIGPSALIVYFDRIYNKEQKEKQNTSSPINRSKQAKKRK